MSYEAIVCKVKTRPHPNADRLQLGSVIGHQVVVGPDVVDGQLGVFFPCDGQLSEEMCAANDLIGYTDPETGQHKGGFFPRTRRVRAQKFRGEKSDGYWTTFDRLKWTGCEDLKEGTTFTELNGKVVCNKYYTSATQRSQSNSKGKKHKSLYKVTRVFPKHVDTKQFKYYKDRIPPDAVVYITEKLHGTSGRTGNILETKNVHTRFKFLKMLFGEKKQYKLLNGSRKVILQPGQKDSFRNTTLPKSFRTTVTDGLFPYKGEIIYYEIVGFVETHKPIMTEHPIKPELKDVHKQYGETMLYKYGCNEGECRMFVYRITRVNEDGDGIDLSWPQVQGRCKELGLKTVPLLVGPIIGNQIDPEIVDQLMEGPSTLDHSHIREGVVVRVESSDGTVFLKNKSWVFGVLEGYVKDNENYVDMEEVS